MISHKFEKLIDEPAHIQNKGSQTSIGLIYRDKSFFVDFGVLASLDPYATQHYPWAHELSDSKSNFYNRPVWDYNKANVQNIYLADTNWFTLFHHLSVNEISLVLPNTVLGILSKIITNETVTCHMVVNLRNIQKMLRSRTKIDKLLTDPEKYTIYNNGSALRDLSNRTS